MADETVKQITSNDKTERQVLGFSVYDFTDTDGIASTHAVKAYYIPRAEDRNEVNAEEYGFHMSLGINGQEDLIHFRFTENKDFCTIKNSMYLENCETELEQNGNKAGTYSAAYTYKTGAHVSLHKGYTSLVTLDIDVPYTDETTYCFRAEINRDRSFKLRGFTGQKFYDPQGCELTKAYPHGKPIEKKNPQHFRHG